MKKQAFFALLVLWFCAPSVSAAIIELDFLVVHSGSDAIFGDDFDDELLSAHWTVLAGDPGPETGTTVHMEHGDWMGISLVNPNPNEDLTVRALMDVIDLPAGSSVALMFHGGDTLDAAALTVIADPFAAFVADESGDPLGGTALPLPSPSSLDLELTAGPGGLVSAYVNGDLVFQGVTDFGPVTGVSVIVTPEPVTLGLMLFGLSLLPQVRRARRR